jgi:hypothetical protein
MDRRGSYLVFTSAICTGKFGFILRQDSFGVDCAADLRLPNGFYPPGVKP